MELERVLEVIRGRDFDVSGERCKAGENDKCENDDLEDSKDVEETHPRLGENTVEYNAKLEVRIE